MELLPSTGVRVLIRYDVENISEATYQRALVSVFSEPPVDDIYEETFDLKGAKAFSVEFLPGQFDQRADSAVQCVKLLNENEEPVIRTATTYVIEGDVTEEQLAGDQASLHQPGRFQRDRFGKTGDAGDRSLKNRQML